MQMHAALTIKQNVIFLPLHTIYRPSRGLYIRGVLVQTERSDMLGGSLEVSCPCLLPGCSHYHAPYGQPCVSLQLNAWRRDGLQIHVPLRAHSA